MCIDLPRDKSNDEFNTNILSRSHKLNFYLFFYRNPILYLATVQNKSIIFLDFTIQP